ncbi:hypothetical protein [Streptomyces hokutonensis]|uniref:hypothetical protein n=1 Tax=Streptomyces hokutonensis TaxID=1306990 RepID=UPI0037F61B32
MAAVPAHIMFRAITDTVYLGRWGELSRRHALPENVRGRLSRMAAQGAGPEAIVTTAFAHLERAVAYVLTPSGRTVAATPGADAIPAREAAVSLAEAVPVDADGVSPYERWHLCLPDSDDAPPRMLHEPASVLGRCQEARVRSRAEERQTADELGAVLAAPGTDPAVVTAALRACGLPKEGPYRVLAAETGAQRAGPAEGALAEVVAHVVAGVEALGRAPDGTASTRGRAWAGRSVEGAVVTRDAGRSVEGADVAGGSGHGAPVAGGAAGAVSGVKAGRSPNGTAVTGAAGRSLDGTPVAGVGERSPTGTAVPRGGERGPTGTDVGRRLARGCAVGCGRRGAVAGRYRVRGRHPG